MDFRVILRVRFQSACPLLCFRKRQQFHCLHPKQGHSLSTGYRSPCPEQHMCWRISVCNMNHWFPWTQYSFKIKIGRILCTSWMSYRGLSYMRQLTQTMPKSPPKIQVHLILTLMTRMNYHHSLTSLQFNFNIHFMYLLCQCKAQCKLPILPTAFILGLSVCNRNTDPQPTLSLGQQLRIHPHPSPLVIPTVLSAGTCG